MRVVQNAREHRAADTDDAGGQHGRHQLVAFERPCHRDTNPRRSPSGAPPEPLLHSRATDR